MLSYGREYGMGLFRKRDDKQGTGAGRSFARTYDKEKVKPAIRCSICNGEQVAGFVNKKTGKFEEVTLIREPRDLENFKKLYGIAEEVEKIY